MFLETALNQPTVLLKQSNKLLIAVSKKNTISRNIKYRSYTKLPQKYKSCKSFSDIDNYT